jgi:hypothetical protein
MEIYCEESVAAKIIAISAKYNLEAKVIGYTEQIKTDNKENQVVIHDRGQEFIFV